MAYHVEQQAARLEKRVGPECNVVDGGGMRRCHEGAVCFVAGLNKLQHERHEPCPRQTKGDIPKHQTKGADRFDSKAAPAAPCKASELKTSSGKLSVIAAVEGLKCRSARTRLH